MKTNSDIEIYQSSDGQIEVEVTFDHETVWLNQEQLSQLFNRDRTVIGRHIRNIFKEGELFEEVVCADFAHTLHPLSYQQPVVLSIVLSLPSVCFFCPSDEQNLETLSYLLNLLV